MAKIVVTGGSGKVGRGVIPHLLSQGHSILNLDLAQPSPDRNNAFHTMKVDLTNLGQVFNGLSSHFRLSEPFPPGPPPRPDAVLHLAGCPRNLLVPDDECFKSNILSTYNVVEAACKLGIKKIIIASSICVYGITYAEGDRDFTRFPVDETVEPHPTDTYATSKQCSETLAKALAMKFGVDIYILRIGAVVAPEEYGDIFPSYVANPRRWKVHGWSYTDTRDLARMCELCVLKDGLGYQVFNAVNNTNTANIPTEDLLKRECPSIPVSRKLEMWEAPISNQKIRDMLGFEEQHDWRMYYTA